MPKGLSLHIGLNAVDPAAYDGWSGRLASCETDMKTMEAICRDQGFVTSRLATGAATIDAVLSGVRQAADTLVAGDTFVLTFAGHGGSYPDLEGDDRDGRDETWCLYDGQILDDELNTLWFRFAAGVRVLVVSDSCHSGTILFKAIARKISGWLAAEPPLASRLMPATVRDALTSTVKVRRAATPRVAPGAMPACCIVLLSACADSQEAWGDQYSGLFTRALDDTWNTPRRQKHYYDWVHKVLRPRLKRQTPGYMLWGATDRPFIEGPVFSLEA